MARATVSVAWIQGPQTLATILPAELTMSGKPQEKLLPSKRPDRRTKVITEERLFLCLGQRVRLGWEVTQIGSKYAAGSKRRQCALLESAEWLVNTVLV